MIRLDPTTLLVASFLVALTLFLILLSTRIGLGDDARGLRTWLIGDIALLAGQASMAMDGISKLESPPLTWSSGLITASAAIHLLAIRRHREAPGPLRDNWLGLSAAAVFGMVVALASEALPSATARSALFHLMMVCVPAISARLLWPARRFWGVRVLLAAVSFAVLVNGCLLLSILAAGSILHMESTTRLLVGLVMTLLTASAFVLWLQEELRDKLVHDARTDALTGALNRQGLASQLHRELVRAKRRGSSLSIALCDIDHFKAVNDRHGHAVGDAVLKSFVAALQAQIRASDYLSRWGGEEFLVVMPDTSTSDARLVIERMRARLAASAGTLPVTVTFSAGIASTDAEDGFVDFDHLLATADTRLYRAKETRDTVVAA